MEEIHKCSYCNEYQGTKRQVAMHSVTCRKKNPPEPKVSLDPGETLVSQIVTEDEILTKSVDANEQEFVTHTPRERIEPDRTERIPFGSPEAKLKAPKDDGFQYRYFNDNWAKEPDRIKRAERAGYVRVENQEPVRVGTNDDNTPIKGVLMKLPKDLYEADQALKQKEVDKVDEAIKAGTLEAKAGDNRYIPEGIKITHSN